MTAKEYQKVAEQVPLHVKKEEQYKEKFVVAELEERKKQLEELRKFKNPEPHGLRSMFENHDIKY